MSSVNRNTLSQSKVSQLCRPEFFCRRLAVAHKKAQGGRRNGAGECEGTSSARFAVPAVVAPSHSCHCCLKRPVGSSSPHAAAPTASACKISNWAIATSPTLAILGRCLFRLVLKATQDIICTVRCEVLTFTASANKAQTSPQVEQHHRIDADHGHVSKTRHFAELSHIPTHGGNAPLVQSTEEAGS